MQKTKYVLRRTVREIENIVMRYISNNYVIPREHREKTLFVGFLFGVGHLCSLLFIVLFF